jgi:hypothetical protein
MIKLGVSITYLETIIITDEQIAEYREEFPDATLDDIKEAYVQSMLDDKHHWDYDDLDFSEIE